MIPRVRAFYDHREITALFAAATPARFEQAFADTVGRRHGVLFPYARTGLLALLEVLGRGGREIVLPAYTCVVMAHAAVHAGCRPVFADAAPDGFNCGWEELAARVTRETGALVPTHLFGMTMPPAAPAAVTERLAGLPLIHDRTMALGSAWQPQPELRGLADCFGLSLSKTLCMVQGGMVTTDDADMADALRHWRDRRLSPASARARTYRLLYFLAHYALFTPLTYGVLLSLAERVPSLAAALRYYSPDRIELPADAFVQPARWQAAVGLAQLAKLPEIGRRRQELARQFTIGCAGLRTVQCHQPASGEVPSHCILYAERREALIGMMQRRGIEVGRHFDYCIPDLPAYRAEQAGGAYPRARWLAARVCNLPLYPGLPAAHRQAVIAALRAADEALGAAA